MNAELTRRLYGFLLGKVRREAICGKDMYGALDLLHAISLLSTEEAIDSMLTFLERFENG